jgi:hypothetical protein
MGLLLLVAAAAGRGIIVAQSQAPPALDPATLSARDSHQGLLIAADPYLTSDRSQQKFGKKHPHGVGILAIDVYLRNDTNDPIQITLDTIELGISPPQGPRQRLEPLTADEAAMQIVLPQGPNVQARRKPIPGTSAAKGKSKDIRKMADELRPQMLPGDMVGPHATIHGFLFFDVSGHFDWLTKGVLYVPDARRIPSKEKLFFFEVDLGPAVRR